MLGVQTCGQLLYKKKPCNAGVIYITCKQCIVTSLRKYGWAAVGRCSCGACRLLLATQKEKVCFCQVQSVLGAISVRCNQCLLHHTCGLLSHAPYMLLHLLQHEGIKASTPFQEGELVPYSCQLQISILLCICDFRCLVHRSLQITLMRHFSICSQSTMLRALKGILSIIRLKHLPISLLRF